MTPPPWHLPVPTPAPIARHYADGVAALERLVDDSLVHTVPPAALDPANVRDAVRRATTSHGLPLATDPAVPPGIGLMISSEDARRHAPGPVQQMVDQIVQRQREHDAVVLNGLLYARQHRADAAGWTFVGTAVTEPAPEPVRPEPPELWWSRTLAEDDEGEGGLIVREGDEYRRERYARPWWPIDELPADAVRLVPDPDTMSR